MKVQEKRLVAEWVHSAQNGEAAAFERLAAFYRKRLGGWFRRTVGDPHMAEDLLQEVLIRSFVGVRRVRNPWCFDAWICRIAKRVALNSFRKKRAVPYDPQILLSLLDNGEARLLLHGEEADPLDDLGEILREALGRLPRELGSLVREHHQDGIPLDVLARREGTSLSGMKMKLFRARKSLRPFLVRALGLEGGGALPGRKKGRTGRSAERRRR